LGAVYWCASLWHWLPTFIADHYGGPTQLYALLFGMVLHFLGEEGRCREGIKFTARTVLR